jgi:UDP-N-acetylmuramoyl-L-alanyl-D-glutamate--2,6-diaminopimelate ligase
MSAVLKERPGVRERRHSLSTLLRGMAVPARDQEISDLVQDSREVRPGAAFIACPGRRTHGIEHVAGAVQRGAVAVIWQPAEGIELPPLPEHVVVVPVPSLSAKAGEIAARFFGEPSRALDVVAVTGTNGKTTTAYLLAQAAEALGRRAAYLGTLGFGRPGALDHAGLTTPDVVSVQRRLAEARDAGARAVGMEVSSHALDQGRIDAVHVDTAVFTNLSRDHLDYHGTMEAYRETKAKLFQRPGLRRAVINLRDAFGNELAGRLDAGVEAVFFSTANDIILPRAGGWIRLPELRATTLGLTLHVESSWGGGTLRSPLVGEFNAENLLAVLGVLLGWGVPLQKALMALAGCVAPPGRMESFGGGAQPLVLVDYAHSPDALAKALSAAREHVRGRLFCVFGCGGDRDPGKRPLMGAIAESLADAVIVTDDNPRTESSPQIIEQILDGMREPGAAQVVPDRSAAIHQAVADAEAGDVVLVAGKGHEDYQIIGTETRAFSDRRVALDALGVEG